MAPCDAQARIRRLEAALQRIKVGPPSGLSNCEVAGWASHIAVCALDTSPANIPRPDLYVPLRGQPDQGQFAAACGGGNAVFGEGGKFGGGNEHG